MLWAEGMRAGNAESISSTHAMLQKEEKNTKFSQGYSSSVLIPSRRNLSDSIFIGSPPPLHLLRSSLSLFADLSLGVHAGP